MMKCSSMHCHVVCLMVIMCFCGFGLAHVPAMYVLGASLLDVGNNNYFPKLSKANYNPYGIDFPGGKATGRFSNGKNSRDCLAEMLGLVPPRRYFDLIFHTNNTAEFLKGVNFASASAGILDSTNEGNCIPFSKQVDFFNETVEAIAKQIGFEQTHEHISKSFVVINVGSNDIMVATGDGLDHEEYAFLLISTLRPLLKDIYHLGARKFVILSTGAEGCLPKFRAKTKTGDCHFHANLLSKSYNMRLASLLEELQSTYDDFRYSFFDMRIAFKELYKNRKTYGFIEGEVACCGTGKFNGTIQCRVGTVPCSNRSDHIFWDCVHYTEEAAKVFMNLAFQGSTPFVYPINVKQLSELPPSYQSRVTE
ncbi:hypothetical protein J5N97_011326 [Dioscorea zingiberensis]|uniref:GDSL esterase/lipase n=1 Tax=Dioscorea zingiberensis TaxID=325984 RepID=A0A9D5HNL8_9LILI|nr:hypothetical protein J5N97_011326 [Dioscorea zingiberensis]